MLTRTDPSRDDRLDIERALLGSALTVPEALAQILELVRTSDLESPEHRVILDAIRAVHAAGVAVDLVTLKDRLIRAHELQGVGGAAYLARLLDYPGAANVEQWAAILRERALGRELAAVADQIASTARAAKHPTAVLIGRAVERLEALRPRAGTDLDTDTAGAVRSAFEYLDRLASGAQGGLASGLRALDDRLGGLEPGALVVLAGKTGGGKSTMAQNIAESAAAAGQRVLYVSYEMPRDQVTARRLSAEAGVPLARMRTLSDREWAALSSAVAGLEQRPFIIDDSGPTLEQVQAKAYHLRARGGLDLIVIDYLQRMPVGTGPKGESREQQVARLAKGLKDLALRLGVVVLALAQLNRGADARPDKRPHLSDLRESSAIGHEADVVLMLHGTEQEARAPLVDVECWVRKHRSGESDVAARLQWRRAVYRFEDEEPAAFDFAGRGRA